MQLDHELEQYHRHMLRRCFDDAHRPLDVDNIIQITEAFYPDLSAEMLNDLDPVERKIIDNFKKERAKYHD